MLLTKTKISLIHKNNIFASNNCKTFYHSFKVDKLHNNATDSYTVTLHEAWDYEIVGVCGGAEVLLKPASDGTGVIASGAVRAVCEGAGIHNILTKCHRSNNPINVVKATMDALVQMRDAVQVAHDRGISLEKVFNG